MAKRNVYFYLFLLTVELKICRGAEVSKLWKDSVSADTFTYYELYVQGLVHIELESLQGDADIYVSDETLEPDYVNYKLKSTTCGLDSVEVPAEFKRPVGIGIFGQPINTPSTYKITLKLLAGRDENKQSLNLEPRANSGKIITLAPTTDPFGQMIPLSWQRILFKICKIVVEIIAQQLCL